MDIEHIVLDKFKELPLGKKQEVLDFIKFIQQKSIKRRSPCALKGLWKDLNIQITEEDIIEIRREMWGDFPKEDIT
jgi:hypothetical protein